MSKNTRLLKNMGILAIGNLASKFLAFFLTPLYTKELSSIEFGIYDLSMSVISILFPLLTLSIADAVMIFTLKEPSKGRNYFQIGGYILLMSDILMAFIVISSNFLKSSLSFLQIFSGYELYIFVSYVLFSWNNLLLLYTKGLDRIKYIVISGILSSIIAFAGNIYFLLILKMHLRGFYITHIIATSASIFYYYMSVLRVFPKKEKVLTYSTASTAWSMIKYSTPLIVVQLSWWVNNALDKYVVAFWCGTAATGVLAVSYKIPTILNTIQQVFIQAWHISGVIEYGEEGSDLFYRKIFWQLNGVLCSSCSMLIMLAPLIAHFLFLGDFFIAWKYTPFLMLSCVLNGAAGFTGPILSARRDSKSMANSGLVGAITNAILNVILVYFMGIQGATIATAISSVAIFVVRKKKVKEVFDVYDNKLIFLSWVILAVQSTISILDLHYFLQIISFVCITMIYTKALIIVPGREGISFLKNALKW